MNGGRKVSSSGECKVIYKRCVYTDEWRHSPRTSLVAQTKVQLCGQEGRRTSQEFPNVQNEAE